MKMNKKKVLTLALVLCVVAILSVGSLAWFNAKDEVKNTFKVATDSEGKANFSIDLFEHKANGDKEDVGLTFENILPGSQLSKDPTIQNTGAYNEYARVKVTVNHANAWKTACNKYGISDLATIFGGYDAAKWTRGEVITETNGDTLTYVYYLNRVLAPNSDEILFTSVTIPTQFVQADFAGMTDFTLDIVAEAIQADNLPATVTNAQGAFALLTAN